MANVTGAHLSRLDDEACLSFEPCLVAPRPAPKRLRALLLHELGTADNCYHALRARLRRGSLRRGDVVLVDLGGCMAAAEVWAIWSVNGVAGVLVSLWNTLIKYKPVAGSATWREVEQPELLPLDDVLCACTYRRYASGVVTLVPPQHRKLLT